MIKKTNKKIEKLEEEITNLKFARDYYQEQNEASKVIIYILIAFSLLTLLSHLL